MKSAIATPTLIITALALCCLGLWYPSAAAADPRMTLHSYSHNTTTDAFTVTYSSASMPASTVLLRLYAPAGGGSFFQVDQKSAMGIAGFPLPPSVAILDTQSHTGPFIFQFEWETFNDFFCPENAVTRAEMAESLLRAKYGASYSPPSPVGIFADVPTNHPRAAYIEALYNEGVTGGCGGGNFCPNRAVTREETAVLVLRTEEGPTYFPADTAAVFADVPEDHWSEDWVNEFAARGYTGGCGTNTYCPTRSVNRQELAAYLLTMAGQVGSVGMCQNRFADVGSGFCAIVERSDDLGYQEPCAEDFRQQHIEASCMARAGEMCPAP